MASVSHDHRSQAATNRRIAQDFQELGMNREQHGLEMQMGELEARLKALESKLAGTTDGGPAGNKISALRQEYSRINQRHTEVSLQITKLNQV